MRASLTVGMLLFIGAIVIGVLQLWFNLWSVELFTKIELTLGALACILIVVWFVVKEYREDKANRSGNHLD